MTLNLPIFDKLANSKNILIAGMGGGYDVFCGLPIFYELQQQGKNAYLGNFSSIDITKTSEGERINKYLVGVGKQGKKFTTLFKKKMSSPESFCELHLSEWLKTKGYESSIIWCFHKTGAQPLIKSYQQLVKKLNIDTVILVDGGVDSLIKGDEQDQGTLLEDLTSLCAVNSLPGNIKKYLVSIGLGVERNIFYGDVLENIAELTKKEAFLGSCSLIQSMESYQFYQEGVLYVQNHPEQFNDSVINSSIISAVKGEYGNYHLIDKTEGSILWINPLMSIYWCFELSRVAQWNLLNEKLKDTKSFADVVAMNNKLKNTDKRQTNEHIKFEQSHRK